MTLENLAKFKEIQKQNWALFAPLEMVTTMPAADLVKFSQITSKDHILDVGCGTGVVAITAARLGAQVDALDLSPVLIDHARENAQIAKVEVNFKEGDAEALPYPDKTFDAVLSQFGHMFAPRPQVTISEMLRVLKPGGTIAFSTWPPDLFVGRMFGLVSLYCPPMDGVSPPPLWGNPSFVKEYLGDQVQDLIFDQGLMRYPLLSLGHYWQSISKTLGPVIKLVQDCKDDSERLNKFKMELNALAAQYYCDNHLHQHFLMSRAIKC